MDPCHDASGRPACAAHPGFSGGGEPRSRGTPPGGHRCGVESQTISADSATPRLSPIFVARARGPADRKKPAQAPRARFRERRRGATSPPAPSVARRRFFQHAFVLHGSGDVVVRAARVSAQLRRPRAVTRRRRAYHYRMQRPDGLACRLQNLEKDRPTATRATFVGRRRKAASIARPRARCTLRACPERALHLSQAVVVPRRHNGGGRPLRLARRRARRAEVGARDRGASRGALRGARGGLRRDRRTPVATRRRVAAGARSKASEHGKIA